MRIGIAFERYRLTEGNDGKYPERLLQLATQVFYQKIHALHLRERIIMIHVRIRPKWTSNDDQPNQPWIRPSAFYGFQSSPYWSQCFGVNSKSELPQWYIDEVEELDRSVFLQSNDLQF